VYLQPLKDLLYEREEKEKAHMLLSVIKDFENMRSTWRKSLKK
jgi:hypothetical protein